MSGWKALGLEKCLQSEPVQEGEDVVDLGGDSSREGHPDLPAKARCLGGCEALVDKLAFHLVQFRVAHYQHIRCYDNTQYAHDRAEQ